MSSDRINTRPLKPVLASNRVNKAPLAPRVAIKQTPTAATSSANTPKLATRSSLVSPRLKGVDDPSKETVNNGNITPRSAARKSRVESVQNSPSQEDIPIGTWPRSVTPSALHIPDRSSAASAIGIGSSTTGLSRPKIGKSMSAIGDSASRGTQSILHYRSAPNVSDVPAPAAGGNVESRFFHASDMPKQELVPKKPELRKTPTFFYADGQEDIAALLTPASAARSPSPSRSLVQEQPAAAPWLRADLQPPSTKSTPVLSPTLSSIAASSPFFTPPSSSHLQVRSASPSKENIHLSYRKGASQIFGTRPISRPTAASVHDQDHLSARDEQPRAGLSPPHKKSPSLSSIDSGTSHQSRRRSATYVDVVPPASVRQPEVSRPSSSRVASPPLILPTIDTSLANASGTVSPPEANLSPTRLGSSELAADARRERKVLDLEISNSSLLAINASLEREVRRQRAELKRYRRLSRAGHFPLASSEHSGRLSGDLDALGEDESDDVDGPGRLSEPAEIQEDISESDEDENSIADGEDSVVSDGLPSKHHDRLARDEKHLRLDLQRHKELLTQSQGMNQSLKRCMYATEEMIRDGKRALEYRVDVTDVKLGGRILTGHEDDDDLEREHTHSGDDTFDDSELGMESAQRLLDVWQGVGRQIFEGSEGSGDRDSGVEVDKVSARNSTGLLDDVQISKINAGLRSDFELHNQLSP